jgi:hypothetical protein
MTARVPPDPPHASLVIRVAVARRDPLAGIASAERDLALPFDSWFELLDALSRIICAGDDPTGKSLASPAGPDGRAPSSNPAR